MVDYRERVSDDRGLIKQIEMAIPGFRGYRKREDLRIADALLRKELANSMKLVINSLEAARDNIVRGKYMDMLEPMGRLVVDAGAALQRLEHAEQGYTGISPDYRITEQELNQMYEWDLGLIGHIRNLQQVASTLRERTGTLPESELAGEISRMARELEAFTDLFGRRREFIAGLTMEG